MQKAKETILIRKTVKQLTDPRDQDGKGLPPIVFFIPAYQRGYRWRKEEVKQLLDDIWDFSYNKPDKKGKKEIYYCLQPLVVKGCDNKNLGDYEVIDGQQRLTTVFIILQAIHHFTIKKWVPADKLAQNPYTPIFSIKYETREHSDEWLPRINDIDFRKGFSISLSRESNPDHRIGTGALFVWNLFSLERILPQKLKLLV